MDGKESLLGFSGMNIPDTRLLTYVLLFLISLLIIFQVALQKQKKLV